MPDYLVGIDSGSLALQIAQLKRNLDRLPGDMIDNMIDAVNPVIVKAMQEYDPARYVTRRAAYGVTFFTARQRRYFFAVILPRGLPYQRTGDMARRWRILGKGRKSIIVNESAAAYFTMDNQGQSRHETLVGWRTVEQRLRFAETEYIEAAREAIRKVVLEFNQSRT